MFVNTFIALFYLSKNFYHNKYFKLTVTYLLLFWRFSNLKNTATFCRVCCNVQITGTHLWRIYHLLVPHFLHFQQSHNYGLKREYIQIIQMFAFLFLWVLLIRNQPFLNQTHSCFQKELQIHIFVGKLMSTTTKMMFWFKNYEVCIFFLVKQMCI